MILDHKISINFDTIKLNWPNQFTTRIYKRNFEKFKVRTIKLTIFNNFGYVKGFGKTFYSKKNVKTPKFI